MFVICTGSGWSQNLLADYLKHGDELYQKGDYIYALDYYSRAMDIDSNTIHILWKYAEALRAYKDYRKAEIYYGKIYQREETKIFPSSLLQFGLMQKYNGKYDAALETFKLAKKKYGKDKNGYLFLKSRREYESCLWAKSAVKDHNGYQIEKLPRTVNTENSEFGHGIYNDRLFFSSLRGDSVSSAEEVYGKEYKTRIYTSQYSENQFEKDQLAKDLAFAGLNSGNGTFSLDGKRFYFSLCEDNNYNYKCKIMVATYTDGKWKNIDTLGDIINEKGANTTMPFIGQFGGGEVLFFSSDRKNGKGGMDIYYSFIKNGTQFGKVQSFNAGNSPDNDITPFWDENNQRLYFSSSWHDGFGGYDVFYSEFKNNRFEKPVNVGIPTNSSANDTYFFIHGDSSYVTSNRVGVFYSKNPTCCSDIFVLSKPIYYAPPTPVETLEELNKRLPVTLYFHNDWPDPKTTATTTRINYFNNYLDYVALLPTYKKEYAAGLTGDKITEAQEDIEDFFTEYVHQGVKDLEQFRDLMLEELDKGTSLELTVKGFASPLAKTDYNVSLTKRRIASLVNYLREYNNGVFTKYLDGTAVNGASITIKQIPFGEYTANKLVSDNINDQKNSVYSRAASLERKIEIQSVNIVSKDSSNVIDTDNSILHIGKIASTDVVSRSFTIKNISDSVVHFQKPEVSCDCIKVISPASIEKGQSADIRIQYIPKNDKGNTVQSVVLKTLESNKSLKLVITAEVIP